MTKQKELQKSIGLGTALATVAGTVIGAGVFFKASAVTEYTGSSSLAMWSWILGGIITICAGLTVAELAAMYPETGGLTRYISHAYGEFWGYLSGWAQSVVYFPANVAAIAIAFGTQVVNLFTLSNLFIIPISALCALSLYLINFISIKAAGRVTSIAFICKLIPLIAIVILGFFHDGNGSVSLFPVVAGQGHSIGSALGQGLLATMFAYDGWLHVGNIAGEMKNPKRDLPLAISIGIALVMIVYVAVNGVFYWTEPINHIAGNMNIASDISKIIFGNIGGKIITVGILISVYGGLNGYIMTGMRVPYILGYQKQLPFSQYFAKLNTAGVPVIAGVSQLIIAVLMMLSGQFDAITNMLVFVIWLFYTMSFTAIIKLRKTEPDIERPYKVPLYPIIPLIAICGGLFILINTILTELPISLIGLAITAIGIPIYIYTKKNRRI